MPYTVFRAQIESGNVKEVTSRGDEIQGQFKNKVKYPPDDKNAKSATKFETVRPSFGDDKLLTLMLKKNVTVNAKPLDEGTPLWQTIIFGFGPTILIVGLFIWFARRAAAGGGAAGLSGLGRSKAKRYEASDQRTTFADVAGIDEAEEELVEIVDARDSPRTWCAGRTPRQALRPAAACLFFSASSPSSLSCRPAPVRGSPTCSS